MTTHLEGRPKTVGTYRNHGCRCPDCTAAATEYMRKMRQQRDSALNKVQSRRQVLAISWIREHHPDVWADLLQQAYDDLNIERRPQQRPANVRRPPK